MPASAKSAADFNKSTSLIYAVASMGAGLVLPRSRRRDKWTESLPSEVIGHATFPSL